MRVSMQPQPESLDSAKAESGIKRVVEAYARYLPEFDVELVPDGQPCDLRAVHAGAASSCDIAHLHGLYWTADYEAAAWEWKVNASVISSARTARAITVPSEWVAQTLRREMRIDPAVIGHGIEWESWAQHQEETQRYVLWNKNRPHDVCDPTPVTELAKLAPDLSFVTTFATTNAPDNVKSIGLLPHDEMRKLVQAAAVYLATTKETFGIGVLEAMAAGVPVLGWDFGNLPSLVEHDVNGYLVKPGNYEELRKGLAHCWSNRARLGEAGRALARQYDWPSVCRLVSDVYHKAMETEQPTAAIIIPSFNYNDKVGRAIESALNQNYPHLTAIIVVDDGSTDGGLTERTVAEWRDKDPRVEYIRTDNGGVAAARNLGIANAPQAKYIACLDADDAIAPTFLERCIAELEADRTLGIAYTGLLAVLPDGSQQTSPWPPEFSYDRQLQRQNQVPTCCTFRRLAWERTGGYRSRYCPNGAGSEDAEFWLRIGAYGWGGKKVTAEPLFIYSHMSGRVTSDPNYHEVDWLAWHPWVKDGKHPIASIATPANHSHPVRSHDGPWVSVVIPVGPGHGQFLVDALDSLEAQTFRLWEAVVVNDSGEDLPLTAYPYIVYVRTNGRRGPGHARNVGALAASAPFLSFLDADDYLQPTYLEECIEARKNSGEWLYTDVYLQGPEGKMELYQVHDFDVEALWREGLGAVTVMVSKGQWEDAGGFAEDMPNREDWDFYFRLAAAGKCGRRIPLPLLTYRHLTGTRRDRQDPELIAALRDRYPLEGLMASCGTCTKTQQYMDVTPMPNFEGKRDAGWVPYEYIGKNRGDVVFQALSPRRYVFGNNDHHRVNYVHPDDIPWFQRRSNLFKQRPEMEQLQRNAPIVTDAGQRLGIPVP